MKSGNTPFGISLTNGLDLVYTDPDDRSINLVSNTRIKTLIRLQGLKPRSVRGAFSGDILVLNDRDDDEMKFVDVFHSYTKETYEESWSSNLDEIRIYDETQRNSQKPIKIVRYSGYT